MSFSLVKMPSRLKAFNLTAQGNALWKMKHNDRSPERAKYNAPSGLQESWYT